MGWGARGSFLGRSWKLHRGGGWLSWGSTSFEVLLNAAAGPGALCMPAQLLGRVWLCHTMDCSPPGSSVCGVLQAGILEWVAVSSRRSSRDQTHVFCISRWILYHWATWEVPGALHFLAKGCNWLTLLAVWTSLPGRHLLNGWKTWTSLMKVVGAVRDGSIAYIVWKDGRMKVTAYGKFRKLRKASSWSSAAVTL